MKLWLILAVAAGIIAWSLKSCSDRREDRKNPSGGIMSDIKAKVPGMGDAPVPESSNGVPGGGAETFEPVSTFVYTFKNRPIPEAFGGGSSSSALGGGASPRMGGNGSSAATITYVDKGSNSIIFQATAAEAAAMRIALHSIDTPSDEAFVDASLIFVKGDRVRDFEAGVSWSEGLGVGGSFDVSPGGFGVVLPAGKVGFSLNVMAENGTLEVVDRPRVRIAQGEVSEVVTAVEVAVPSTVIGEGLARTAIEFKRVGLTFKVEPFFFDGGRVRLKLSAENGLVGEPRTVGGVEVPEVSTQRVSSVVTLESDDGIIVGGLETERRARRFGFISDSESVESGRLYLCVFLRSGLPKAVDAEALPYDGFAVAPAVPSPRKVRRSFWGFLRGGRDEDEGLLPPKDWQSEETQFIRARGAK